ncbi:carboxylesterase family protein [Labilibaculum sp. K2S]|uniref:carboxylesterase/lipase family protein n=1 Tax=Labilibaculum sp. K2S TaxID=3056386 RepID=UPI0025A40DC6|nr:carboxylesterase family protein [Labilibaculum sp. K2S]MDM8161529.1 carboxylesterase family protein [Labilibaculum sp. K2S]
MRTIKFFASLFVMVITVSCTTLEPDQIKVEEGILQGTIVNGLTIFKGIPFAKPPVGELRWKAPQPAEKWEGIKQAIEFAPAPMQGGNPVAGKSEDCLYLNVWTPAKTPDEKVPVLVWIYGGGFSFGSASDPVSDGEMLAKKGVVLVSISYRVGQLGFLAHPELSAESPVGVSGNYGLLDQIAALEWIQKNIAAFGGDPDKVTIFGESAGGISVSMLCASPLAKGLFHGAISQSGGSFGPTRSTTYPGENMKTLKQAEADGEAFVKNHGASSIAELREMEAEKFIPAGWTMPGGWPIVDGYVIPGDQYELYQEGKYNDVPVLIGYNSDEGASFMWEKDSKVVINNVKTRYGKFADALLQAYPVEENSVPKTARDLMRDAAFGWHTWSWAQLQSKTGKSDVYYYYFDQHPVYPEDSPMFGYGSPHGQDVAYVFQHLDNNSQTSESDSEISEAMGTYWVNFAKYGNPNGEGVPEWPAFGNENKQIMYLGSTPHLGSVPSEEALKVLDAYFEWRRTPNGEDWAK